MQGDQLGRRNGLGSVDWLRVVLDEAHNIRNSDTQQAKVRQLCICTVLQQQQQQQQQQ
jgi:hypothetical protein